MSNYTATKIYHGDDEIQSVYSGDTLVWNKPTILYVTLTSDALTHTLCFTQSEANGVTIDWGDGSPTETVAQTTVTISHTWDAAGDYEIRLTAADGATWCAGYNDGNYDRTIFNTYASGFQPLTKVSFGVGSGIKKYSFYWMESLTSVDGAIGNGSATGIYGGFYGCSNLTAVSSELLKNCSSVTGADNLFYNCGLAVIPEGLLDSLTSLVSATSMFAGTAITTVPAGLFDNCRSAENFRSCFSLCRNLTTLPPDLFKYTSATEFYRTFMMCTALASVPSGLFNGCSEVTSFRECFNGCTSLASVPTGLFDDCESVETFHGCFYGCTSIIQISSGLFDNCTSVINFQNLFHGCTSIESVPAGLFANNTLVTNVSGIFRNCSAIESDVPELWDTTRWPMIDSYYRGFYNCTNAANYADIPSDWK